jgi:hypothetical protein
MSFSYQLRVQNDDGRVQPQRDTSDVSRGVQRTQRLEPMAPNHNIKGSSPDQVSVFLYFFCFFYDAH